MSVLVSQLCIENTKLLTRRIQNNKIECLLPTRSSTGESMMIQSKEQTAYLFQPRSIRQGWRTCCQTLTTSLRSVPSMELALDLLVNSVRCSQRDHVREMTEPMGKKHSPVGYLSIIKCNILFCLQHHQTLPGCGAILLGQESGCMCGGITSSMTGLATFPSHCTIK